MRVKPEIIEKRKAILKEIAEAQRQLNIKKSELISFDLDHFFEADCCVESEVRNVCCHVCKAVKDCISIDSSEKEVTR